MAEEFPVITRYYATLAIATSIICYMELLSPQDLYLDSNLVLKECQYWRLVTNFFYFGEMDLEYMLHMFLLAQFLKLLEESSFRGRKGDFVYMLLFGATVLTGNVLIGEMIPYVADSFAEIRFLSNSLTYMLVYVWSKQYPLLQLSFLGLFTFPAAYFPWIILGLSNLLYTNGYGDLLGMIAGHAYYYLDDIYPRLTGRRLLKTPSFIKFLFSDDPAVAARPPNVRFAAPPVGQPQ